MSVPTVAQYVKRYRAADAKEADAIVSRVQAVMGLIGNRGLKPADASRAIFDVAPDVKLTSRETSPVSHATTTAKVVSAFGLDVHSTDADVRTAIRHAFRVSTGRVKAQRLTEALKSVKQGDSVEAFADVLLTPTPSQNRGAQKTAAEKGKPSENTVANAVPTVIVPATLPELLAALQAIVDGAENPGKVLTAVEGFARRNRNRIAHPVPAEVPAETAPEKVAARKPAAKRGPRVTK